jgi:hypothetical protein
MESCLRSNVPPPWQDAEPDDEHAISEEVGILDEMLPELVLHRLPLLGLGSGRGSLAWKFYVTMFASFLESGESPRSFQEYVKSFFVHSSDFGVEFGLTAVEPIEFRAVFPWWGGRKPLTMALGWTKPMRTLMFQQTVRMQCSTSMHHVCGCARLGSLTCAYACPCLLIRAGSYSNVLSVSLRDCIMGACTRARVG